VPAEAYVERLHAIAEFKKSEAVLQIGTFGNPSRLEDVAGLTLEPSDISSLKACRVGDCGLQHSGDAIATFKRDVDWRGADPAQQANEVMRRLLVAYVAGYQAQGTPATMEYADGEKPMQVGREFALLATPHAVGWRDFPGLRRHLLDFPATPGAPMHDVIYWSKERVGRTAVVSVTHLAIAHTADTSPAEFAIASKQIYATHYFDASLGLTVLLRDRTTPDPATYVVYLNLSRIDMFGGMLGGLTRKIVTSRARSTVAEHLALTQGNLERRAARK
jgi:hypothetical protein